MSHFSAMTSSNSFALNLVKTPPLWGRYLPVVREPEFDSTQDLSHTFLILHRWMWWAGQGELWLLCPGVSQRHCLEPSLGTTLRSEMLGATRKLSPRSLGQLIKVTGCTHSQRGCCLRQPFHTRSPWGKEPGWFNWLQDHYYFEAGSLQIRLALNSPQPSRLSLLNARIRGMSHYTWLHWGIFQVLNWLLNSSRFLVHPLPPESLGNFWLWPSETPWQAISLNLANAALVSLPMITVS